MEYGLSSGLGPPPVREATSSAQNGATARRSASCTKRAVNRRAVNRRAVNRTARKGAPRAAWCGARRPTECLATGCPSKTHRGSRAAPAPRGGTRGYLINTNCSHLINNYGASRRDTRPAGRSEASNGGAPAGSYELWYACRKCAFAGAPRRLKGGAYQRGTSARGWVGVRRCKEHPPLRRRSGEEDEERSSRGPQCLASRLPGELILNN